MLFRLLNNSAKRGQNVSKSFALVLLLIFIALMLLAMIQIILYSEHECSGLGCIVCAMLKNAKSYLDQVGRALSLALLAGSLVIAVAVTLLLYYVNIISSALTDVKVQLNN